MTKNRCLIIIISISFLIGGCSRHESPRLKEEMEKPPDARIEGATIILTQNGIKNAIVDAACIYRWEDKDSTEASDVKIVLFDTTGAARSELKAKRGLVRERTAGFALFGDVVGISSDSTVLITQSLFWNPKTELITTDDFVEIKHRDGSILQGWGLRADRDLKNAEIGRDVSGRVEKILDEEISGNKEPERVADDSAENR